MKITNSKGLVKDKIKRININELNISQRADWNDKTHSIKQYCHSYSYANKTRLFSGVIDLKVYIDISYFLNQRDTKAGCGP